MKTLTRKNNFNMENKPRVLNILKTKKIKLNTEISPSKINSYKLNVSTYNRMINTSVVW